MEKILITLLKTSKLKMTLEFKLADLWIGAFWKQSITTTPLIDTKFLDIWVCFIPCFPVHLTLKETIRNNEN